MKYQPPHKIGRLRKGRLSIPGARYFITVCTRDREAGLTNPKLAEALIDCLRQQHRDQDYSILCATIMPDHVHVLFRLGKERTLSQTQAKFKSLSKARLAEHNLPWQDNFYDHRLRVDTSMEAFARYVFLNPYRKGLISTKDVWPWWVLNRNYRPEFLAGLGEYPRPPAEWLGERSTVEDLIEADKT